MFTKLLHPVFLCIFAFCTSTALADGLIIIPHPPHPFTSPNPFAPLEVSYHRVNVAITDQAAVTTVDQEFYNPTPARLEGTYLFPLPPGAHIDKFAMDINGTMTQAELLPADKAKAIYEDIVRRMKDPALLEYLGRDAFKVRIFPIEPHSRKKISIKYTQLLKPDSGLTEYTYPLNTEKFSSRPLGDVSVKVTIQTKDPLKNVYCPTHPAEVKRPGDHQAVIGWEERNVKPDTDFKIIYSTTAKPIGIDVLTYRPSQADEGYFLLMASPGSLQTTPQPKDIVLAIDTSGSMAGGKLAQARKALKFCLENLNKDDRFEIVRFSTEAESLFGKVVPATPDNLQRANAFVDSLTPIGGTALAEALDKCLAAATTSDERPAYVLFMTDGMPTIGQTKDDAIVALANQHRTRASSKPVRVFSLGIGTDVNTNLLDRIASETHAASQYVLPKEDLEVKLSNLYMKIRNPVLTNLTLSSGDAVTFSQIYPKPLPDLFSGDVLVVFGKFIGKGSSQVTLTGTINGQTQRYSTGVDFSASSPQNDYVPRLWATRRVGWLLDEVRLNGESSELKNEIVALARQYGIVTPYTAYLILEDEGRRNIAPEARTFSQLDKGHADAEQARRLYDMANASAKSESARSGAGAVENSMRMKSLKENSSLAGARQSTNSFGMPGTSAPIAAPSMPATTAAGGAADALSQQQLRIVNNRAFFQNGRRWVDSNVQAQQNLRQKQIKFGSDEYFALVKNNRDLTAALALGNELDIVIGDTLYQVRDN